MKGKAVLIGLVLSVLIVVIVIYLSEKGGLGSHEKTGGIARDIDLDFPPAEQPFTAVRKIKKVSNFPQDKLAILLASPPSFSSCKEILSQKNGQGLLHSVLTASKTGTSIEDIYIALSSIGAQSVYDEFIVEHLYGDRLPIDSDKKWEIRGEKDLSKKFEMITDDMRNGYFDGSRSGLVAVLQPPSSTLSLVDIDFKAFNHLLKEYGVKATADDASGFIPVPENGKERRRQYLDGFKLIFDKVDFSKAHLIPDFYKDVIQRLVATQEYDEIKFMVERGLVMDSPVLQWNVADQLLYVSSNRYSFQSGTAEFDAGKALDFMRWLEKESVLPSQWVVENAKNLIKEGYVQDEFLSHIGQLEVYRDRYQGYSSPQETLQKIGIKPDLAAGFKQIEKEYLECLSRLGESSIEHSDQVAELSKELVDWYETQQSLNFQEREILLSLGSIEAVFLLYQVVSSENATFVEGFDPETIRDLPWSILNSENMLEQARMEILGDVTIIDGMNVPAFLDVMTSNILAQDNHKYLSGFIDLGVNREAMGDAIFRNLIKNRYGTIAKEAVSSFSQAGIDIYKQREPGISILHLLVSKGHLPVVKAIAEADNFLIDPGSLNLLDVALLSYEPESTDILDYLLLSDIEADEYQMEVLNALRKKYPDDSKIASLMQ
ncbi:hypothetical protein QSV34_03145 [Porticoccus sp. W117]|uniref:hypothetical protein n=1 Tax=Porticoccus sp. W117 TaxID=3054777 RepID=UPI002594C81F|nr:hypothetical protein [Porticoccus sp. W117]MDM3870345.1 hypothetical protein [Porticoccus sp. W117]